MEEALKKILDELQTLNEGQKNLQAEVKLGKEDQKIFQAEVRLGFEGVNKKLDVISAQVAHNTEQEVRLDEVVTKVEENSTDIKLLKKVIINQ